MIHSDVQRQQIIMARPREKIAAGKEQGFDQEKEDGFEFSSAERNVRENIAVC